MTKSDFGLMVLRPIFVAALICAFPNGLATELASHPNYALGGAMLVLPTLLLLMSSKGA